MSLETVDLLSVLRRARKSPAVPPVESGAVEQPAATPPADVAATLPPVFVKAKESTELADIHAELYSDEMLMRRILGLLYRSKKRNPNSGYVSILDMEKILNVEREGATFIMSYMKTQKVMEMDDKSRMAITVTGINYLRGVFGVHANSLPPIPAPITETDSLD